MSTVTPETPPKPLVALPLPFSSRLNYAIQLWTLKALARTYVNLQKLLGVFKSKGNRATYTKVYPAVPSITNRVFIPASHKPGDAALPLFIDIHGGGFAIGDPILDNSDNLILAQQHRICVVSIGYRLAPQHRFPGPVEDVAALIEAVLEDPDLPVDKNKVAVGGYSAGGNLCLAAPQLRGLNKKIKASVAYYPVVDFAVSTDHKLETRASGPEPDVLKDMGKLFNWAYVPPNTDLKNPLLSPIFAEREKLPPKVLLIGCEYDMLCNEAERMAERLAKEDGGERKAEDDGNVWQTKSVRWEKIKGRPHGFNQMGLSGEKERLRKRRTDEMHAAVAKWLFDEVYA